MATIDLMEATANAVLDAFVALFPAGSILQLRSGASPGADATATGTLIASITLPATPWNAAGTSAVTKNGTWEDASADNAGTIAHYRLKNAGDTHRVDGDVTATGGGGSLTVDNTSVTAGQDVLITAFQYTS